jgi:hypothetical protein
MIIENLTMLLALLLDDYLLAGIKGFVVVVVVVTMLLAFKY